MWTLVSRLLLQRQALRRSQWDRAMVAMTFGQGSAAALVHADDEQDENPGKGAGQEYDDAENGNDGQGRNHGDLLFVSEPPGYRVACFHDSYYTWNAPHFQCRNSAVPMQFQCSSSAVRVPMPPEASR